MKLIYCTFNVTIQETLLKKLTAEGVKSYQLFEGVKVKPAIGNPRLDTAVWPGYNSAIIMQFEDENQAKKVIDVLKSMNENAISPEELITASMLPMDAYFND
ncbi:MAG: hypothetical protein PF448_12630 [Bacteroidales bacterium]|jgi:hypothetical protein|nr:hypothetical protein [Bacteroidales bacterium]